jgi:ankyrin repeat protein
VNKRHEELIQAIVKNDAFRTRGLLIENPELVKTRDPEGRTPLLLCLYYRNEDLANVVRRQMENPDIYEAVALGEMEQVEALLTSTQDGANAVAPDGFGLLGLAVYFGRLDVARYLLEAGADPDTPSSNDFKVRPIHSAAAHLDADRSLDLVRLLLDAGANPNVSQAGGWSPLHQAAAHGRREAAELLVGAGANRSATSDDGRTPWEMAQAKGHEDLESLLKPNPS